MVVSNEYEIVSCDDFEINVKRQNLLKYKVSYPDDQPIRAILFIIPGFGGDSNGGYLDHLREYAAETFSVAAVNVFYHCYHSRPANGAHLEFDDVDLIILQDIAKLYQIDFSTLAVVNKNTVLTHINNIISERKKAGLMSQDKKIMLPMTLVPENNEYQNFGLMQAIDHLNVLCDLSKRLPGDIMAIPNIFLGSSHGGYLASLIAKIAPSSVDYVIDNSSYVTPPLQYIVGKETDITRPEYILTLEHLQLNCFVQTLWTTVSKSPYYFSNDRYRIRNLLDTEHLNTLPLNQIRKPVYISYHSTCDKLAPAKDKIEFYKTLQNLGFSAKLHLIEAKDVDGHFIKSLEHGMQMSLKELLNKEIPKILKLPLSNQQDIHNEIRYKCDSVQYHFQRFGDAFQYSTDSI